MQTPIINSLLLGLISLASFIVIAYWWVATKGTWRQWPAGRSLMGLLGIIAVGFGFGVINALIGVQGYPAKPYIGFALYVVFVGSIIFIGFTIRREMSRGRSIEHHPASAHPTTGTIDITVATDTDKEPSND